MSVVVETVKRPRSASRTAKKKPEMDGYEARLRDVELELAGVRQVLISLQKEVTDFKGEGRRWWSLVLILLSLVAALAGIQQLPKLFSGGG